MSKKETLTLKWGTLKGWSNLRPETVAILQRWADLGTSFSAMTQRNTPEQKAIICELIDAIDGVIENDWTGKMLTKDKAKAYIMGYDG